MQSSSLTDRFLILLAVILAIAGLLFLSLMTAHILFPSAPRVVQYPTIVYLPTDTATPAVTATPVPVKSTDTPPTEPPPTLQPTATWFYAIPAQPTPIPTPILLPAAPFPSTCDGPGRMNIVLIGLDGFDANNYRAARADTVIIVGVNFSAKSAQMLSIPRDLWVQLPGLAQISESRINTAYHYGELYGAPGGGPGELSAALANTFGLRLDRYVVVNFPAFIAGVDALGGIDVNLPKTLHDSKYPLRDGSGTIAIDFPAGWVHLDGAAALIYARIRHDSDDFQRMRRQQQVLFAIRDKLLSPETLPLLPALAQALYGSVRTDLTPEDIALLGCLGPQIPSANIQTWVIDRQMTQADTLADGAQILRPNLDAMLPVLQNFNAGE